MTRGPRTAQIGRWASRCGVALLLCAAAGCGPTSAHLAIADARIAIEAARGARAETFAIFEFTCAVEHLRKASEEDGYADFDAATRLARQSRAFAEAARARALGRTTVPGRAVLPGLRAPRVIDPDTPADTDAPAVSPAPRTP